MGGALWLLSYSFIRYCMKYNEIRINMADVLDDIIILRSVFGKVGQKYFMNPVRDPKTGRYPSCVRPVDSKGDMIISDKDRNEGKPLIPENKVFIIEDGTTFNLNDEWQRAEWESIQHCPLIALSRDARDSKGNLLIDGEIAEGKTRARYGTAELYVERPGYETSKRISKKKLIHDADSYIYGDPQGAEGRQLKARLLGKNMRNAPDADITDYLLEISHKSPEKIIDLYTGGDINLRLMFIDAKDKNVIYVKNKVYLYGDSIVLGATDDAVITWMKNPTNQKVLELIKRDTYPDMYLEESKSKK